STDRSAVAAFQSVLALAPGHRGNRRRPMARKPRTAASILARDGTMPRFVIGSGLSSAAAAAGSLLVPLQDRGIVLGCCAPAGVWKSSKHEHPMHPTLVPGGCTRART